MVDLRRLLKFPRIFLKNSCPLENKVIFLKNLWKNHSNFSCSEPFRFCLHLQRMQLGELCLASGHNEFATNSSVFWVGGFFGPKNRERCPGYLSGVKDSDILSWWLMASAEAAPQLTAIDVRICSFSRYPLRTSCSFAQKPAAPRDLSIKSTCHMSNCPACFRTLGTVPLKPWLSQKSVGPPTELHNCPSLLPCFCQATMWHFPLQAKLP